MSVECFDDCTLQCMLKNSLQSQLTWPQNALYKTTLISHPDGDLNLND